MRRGLGINPMFEDQYNQFLAEAKTKARTGRFKETFANIAKAKAAVASMPVQRVYSRSALRAMYDGLINIDDAVRRTATNVKAVELNKEGYVWRWEASLLDDIKSDTQKASNTIQAAWSYMKGYGGPLAKQGIQTPFVLLPDTSFQSKAMSYLGQADSALEDLALYEEQFLDLFRLGWFGDTLLFINAATTKIVDATLWMLKQVPRIPGYLGSLTTYATYAGIAYVAYKLWENRHG